jgi:hypothetical protein
MGAFRASPSGLRWNKPFDRRYHNDPAGHVDFRHQRGDEGNLKTPISCVDHKPILGPTGYQSGYLAYVTAVRVSHLETDEVLGPILILTQFPALGCDHVIAPDRFSGHPRIDACEFEMMTAICAANRSDFESSAIDEYRLAWFEMNEVILVHIEANVSVEAVGATQAPNDKTGLSR